MYICIYVYIYIYIYDDALPLFAGASQTGDAREYERVKRTRQRRLPRLNPPTLLPRHLP